jgi:hypothetical protein
MLQGLSYRELFCLIVRSAGEEASGGGKAKRDGRIAEAVYHHGYSQIEVALATMLARFSERMQSDEKQGRVDRLAKIVES